MIDLLIAQIEIAKIRAEYENEKRAIDAEKQAYELGVKHRAEMRRAFLNTLHPSEHYAHMRRWRDEDFKETMARHEKLRADSEARVAAREQRRKDEAEKAEAARLAAEAKAYAERPHAQKLQDIADLRLKDVLGSLYDWVMKK